jgi:ABC-type antimicrobial peptide transport system permease subunit
VAIMLEDLNLLDTSKHLIQVAQPKLLVQTYKEISPALELFQSQIQLISSFYMVIFMLALIFGIINTMLMAVLERIRELGMIMAIGMNKLRVFMMVVLETILLAVIAAPVGLFLGFLTVQYFKEKGLNLFFFAKEGMKQFGMPQIIYPTAETGVYLQLALAVGITAVLASLYPAFKAIRLRPAEAIRKQ